MTLILYLTQHLISFLILDKRFRLLYVVIATLSSILIFWKLNPGYDILAYTETVGYPEIYEPIFSYILKFISFYIEEPSNVILITQLLLGCFFIVTIFFFKRNKLLLLCVITSSVFFFLSIANNLRQGFATLFMIYGILLLFRKRYFIACVVFFLSPFLHYSSFFFIGILLSLGFLLRKLYHKRTLGTIYFITSIMALVSFILFKSLLPLMQYADYYGRILTLNNERTVLWLKLIPVGGIYIFLEVYFFRFKKINWKVDFVRLNRTFLIIFLTLLALSPTFDEIGSRILFFYFGIELLFQLKLIEINKFQPVFLITLAYTFAFNVWNIISF